MYLWNHRYITMVRGDTLSFGLEIEGLGQDLDTAYMSCKRNYEDPPVFVKSIGDGITKVGEGQYVVRVAPSDTRDLDPGKYHYDLEISANGDVFTVLNGILEIERDVTTI